MGSLKKIIFVFILPVMLFAGVNLKNGNYHVTYSDILIPGGGHDLEISRTYNSRATKIGWFGFGWGSDFETFLQVGADGSVVIHENGTGARTRFTSSAKIDAQAAAQKIIEAMRKSTNLSGKEALDLEKKLAADEEVRQAYARKFNVKAEVAVGTVLKSSIRGLQEVKVLKDGFERTFNSGKSESFDKNGKLTQVKDKHGYKVDLEYNSNGTLKSIKDSQAKQVHFSWYPNGLVKELWSADDKKATYKYKGNDLFQSVDVEGNKYSYDYDQNHNMILISYSDNTTRKLAYHPHTQFVKSVTERDGEVTEYEYGANPKTPNLHYWTIVTKKSVTGKQVSNRYEYEMKTRDDGSYFAHKILTDVNGIKTETVYSPQNSLPLSITRGKHKTTFKYDSKGLLTEKRSTRGEFVELKYHEKFNKISYVKNNSGWTKFDYNGKGNLEEAVDDKGKTVKLHYDRKGRIATMIDFDKKTKEKRVLSFEYNALGKPVEISIKGVGKINVSYDNYGEIKKVDSKEGHKMSMMVTQTFQHLLSIVKPAGVNLSL